MKRDLKSKLSQPCAQGLSVLIYNENRNGQQRVVAEGSTVEDVCNIIGRELKITPPMLYFFGLRRYTDTEQTDHWLAPAETLNTGFNRVVIHFRMRFLPDKDKCNHLLHKDPNCFTYLFWQVNWDFLNDRLQCFKDKSKVDTARGFTVLSILISLRLKNERENCPTEDLISFKKTTHLNDFLPKSLQKIFLDKLILQKSIYNKVKEYQENCPVEQHNSKSVMRIYLGNILRQNQSYYEETFRAFLPYIPPSENDEDESETTVQKQELEIRVELNCKEPKLRAIRKDVTNDGSSEVMSCLIKDLNQIEVIERLSDTNNKQWMVRLLRANGHPQDLHFDTKDETQSFVTCLESFYRLMFDFYGSLCGEYEPKRIKDLYKTPVHGPISEDFVKRKLKKRNYKDFYVIRVSSKVYDQYEILYQKSETLSLKFAVLGTLEVCDDGYRISGDNSGATTELRVLIKKLICNCAFVPRTSVPIRPQNEACDVLQSILISGDFKMVEEDEEQQREKRRQESQPKVYTLSDIQINSLIGQSSFMETHSALLNDRETVVIKQLRINDIKTGHFSKVLESFQSGFQTIINLHEPQHFIGFLGVALGPNMGMLMKQTTHGSLRNFLQNRDIAMFRLTLPHLLDATVQLAQALIYMETRYLFHGNIHCDNILVVGHSTSSLNVKLSDPGMVSLYNKLPINHQINVERLPWLAPELCKEIENVHVPCITIETEIYALGTTIWQMFSGGHSPLTHDIKLIGKGSLQILNFFKEGNVLSCPECLISKSDDPNEIMDIKSALQQQMQDCWIADRFLRPTPKTLLRKLLSNMQSYEETYHKYNIIPENCPEIILSNGPQLHPLLASSGYPNSAMRKPAGDLSCLDAQGANNSDAQNSVETDRQGAHLDAKDNLVVHLGPTCAGDNKKSLLEQQKNDKDSKDLPSRSNTFSMMLNSENSPAIVNINWLLPLGQGHYGAVYKGTLKSSSSVQTVVVKVLKSEMISKHSEDFKKEALIMEKLNHKNIVKFHGSSYDGACLVMEFVENNSLAIYLRRPKTIMTQPQFLQLALDIAEGMEYLSGENIVHCDLAARNVLLTKDLHAKVSDFGLAKILAKDKEYYRKEKGICLPIFWCSMEAIEYQKFSSKSDVWSYGVVLWEMYSNGLSPNVKPFNDHKNLAKCLREGKRLEKPPACPDYIYNLMRECWDENVEKRPMFTMCCSVLKKYHLQCTMNIATATLSQQTQNKNSLIEKNDLEIDQDSFAKGSFGAVYKAKYNDQTVAVKRCMNKEAYVRFKREFELLFQLNNPYIVRFIGVCKETEEVTGSCYVMEYLSGGTLHDHVKKCNKNGKPEPTQKKLKYLIQVAEGMDYLMKKRVIHGDLTAENILLTADKSTVKICDFGFAKSLDDNNSHYKRNQASFKVRWAAPEVLHEQYSISSDIWSYGIVCMEVFLNGEVPNWPHPDHLLLSNIHKPENLKKHFDKLMKNHRFPCPEGCHTDIYNVILDCWKFKETERIHYNEIISRFSGFVETMNSTE